MNDSILTDLLFLLMRDHALSVFLRGVLIEEHNRASNSAQLLYVQLGSIGVNRCKAPFILIVGLVCQISWVRLCLPYTPSHLHLDLFFVFFAVHFHMLIITSGFRLGRNNLIRVGGVLIYYLRSLVPDFLKILNAVIFSFLLRFFRCWGFLR